MLSELLQLRAEGLGPSWRTLAANGRTRCCSRRPEWTYRHNRLFLYKLARDFASLREMTLPISRPLHLVTRVPTIMHYYASTWRLLHPPAWCPMGVSRPSGLLFWVANFLLVFGLHPKAHNCQKKRRNRRRKLGAAATATTTTTATTVGFTLSRTEVILTVFVVVEDSSRCCQGRGRQLEAEEEQQQQPLPGHG